jgi:hypothetical protein
MCSKNQMTAASAVPIITTAEKFDHNPFICNQLHSDRFCVTFDLAKLAGPGMAVPAGSEIFLADRFMTQPEQTGLGVHRGQPR